MIYLIVALALMTAAAGILAWRLLRTREALRESRSTCESYKDDHAIRENLENMLDARNAENKKLRARLRKREEALEALEKEASDLNLNLFHENSMRILREKEESARRMKLELMEKQLDEANQNLRRTKAQAQAEEARMMGIIKEQQETIDRLNARIDRLSGPHSRRNLRKAQNELPDQLTFTDLLGGQ